MKVGVSAGKRACLQHTCLMTVGVSVCREKGLLTTHLSYESGSVCLQGEGLACNTPVL